MKDLLPRTVRSSAGNSRPSWATRRAAISPAQAQRPLQQRARGGHVVVVDPVDPVPGQQVEDRPGFRVVHQVPRQVVDEAVRGPGHHEPPVRERRPQAGAEPAVGQRERARQAVVERQVLLGPVAHRHGRVRTRHEVFDAGHEAVVAAAGDLQVADVPALRRDPLDLDRRGEVVCPQHAAVPPRVGRQRCAVRAAGQPVPAPGQHAQVVVVGVVLHHQHDNVLDLRQQIGADRQVRLRPGTRIHPRYRPRPPSYLALLYRFPPCVEHPRRLLWSP